MNLFMNIVQSYLNGTDKRFLSRYSPLPTGRQVRNDSKTSKVHYTVISTEGRNLIYGNLFCLYNH